MGAGSIAPIKSVATGVTVREAPVSMMIGMSSLASVIYTVGRPSMVAALYGAIPGVNFVAAATSADEVCSAGWWSSEATVKVKVREKDRQPHPLRKRHQQHNKDERDRKRKVTMAGTAR